jgi:DNA-binding transcriptional LysR family regulator
MQLTSAGRLFLIRAEAALQHLKLAQSELTVMDLAHVDALSIGVIDDFDNNLTPRLATILGDSLSGCRFKMITAASFDLISAVQDGKLHLAISASSDAPPDGLMSLPLVRDPFMLVTPKQMDVPLQSFPDPDGIPFLRYEQGQLISQQIEAGWPRHGGYPKRFEIGSHLAMMAMVGRGIGWTISTPLGYMCAHRFHDDLQAHPLPAVPFHRQISLFASTEWGGDVPSDVAKTMRRLIRTHVVDPALAEMSFLRGQLDILDS